MTSAEFVATLEAENRVALEQIAAHAETGDASELSVVALLKLALRNELEATELAAHYIATTPEVDAKLALARQCGDEAKHYRLIADRLAALGVDLLDFDPRAPADSPLTLHLKSLTTTVERAAAGQFAREALAVVRNDIFAQFCESRGDTETAALYRDRIQPDEQHHHQLGRRLLLKYATDETSQRRAHLAAKKTLALADELQTAARLKLGLCRLPGC